MFLRIPGILSEAQLTALRAALGAENAPWVDGRVTAGHQGAAVKHNQQLEESSPLARDLGHFVAGELERHALFVSAVLPLRLYPPLFKRYGAGMAFGTHVDGAVRMIGTTGQKLRTDLSATLFISSPDSDEGGELLVEQDTGSHSAKLDPGELLVYSATSRHRVNPISRGSRLACVFWVQSLVRLTAHYHSLLKMWSEV